jgi:hypothetical protein
MLVWFQRIVLTRRWAAFVAMGLSFLVFGAGTLNLFYVAHANATFLIEHGWLALMEGGALQLVEIVLTALLCMAAYLVFKACEYRLVRWLAEPIPKPTEPEEP